MVCFKTLWMHKSNVYTQLHKCTWWKTQTSLLWVFFSNKGLKCKVNYSINRSPRLSHVGIKSNTIENKNGYHGKAHHENMPIKFWPPFTPLLYSKTGVYRGINYVFYFCSKHSGYSLEPPRWGGSNKYPQSVFWVELWKYHTFLSKQFQLFWR